MRTLRTGSPRLPVAATLLRGGVTRRAGLQNLDELFKSYSGSLPWQSLESATAAI